MTGSLENLYAQYLKHPFISTDTRSLIPNSIFFALKGERFNANAFAASALDNGCVLAVVDDPSVAVNNRYILVDDVLECLRNLAIHHRKQLTIPVIGITGSNGKTTSKELLNAVLSTQFKTHATQGNYNNHIGVPLTILSTPKDAEILIVEMGANHFGEIAELCEISQPNFGLITSLGKAHLEGFGSFENIVETKTGLFRSVKKNDGLVFVNNQFHQLMTHSEHQKRLTFGKENADFTGRLVGGGIFVNLEYKSQIIYTQLIGDYNFGNILAACVIGEYFKISSENIKRGLENYVPANNRSQFVRTEKNTLILDAYNANPTSMEAAIRNFAQMIVDNKVVIVGDMYELGEDSQMEHQKMVDLLKELNFKNVFILGENFANVDSDYQSFPTVDDFLATQQASNINDAYILIKGSRGMKMERIIEYL